MTGDDLARQWCVQAAEVLADTASRAGQLAAALTTDWLDDHGRGWAERVAVLRRELVDAAQHADAVAARLRDTDASGFELAAAITAALRASAVARARGPQLGDTPGARVGDEHGVAIPELPDPPPF